MPRLKLPFAQESAGETHGGDPFACSLYKMLPAAVQELTKQSVYLLEYLHTVPVNEVGIPQFIPAPTPKLKDTPSLNLIYPVEGGIFTHVVEDPEGGRSYYISVEPKLSSGRSEDELMQQLDVELLNHVGDFEGVDSSEDQKRVLEDIVDKIFVQEKTGGVGAR